MFSQTISSIEKNVSVNLTRPDEIVYWTKKWEISPNQLFLAAQATKSNRIIKIRNYLVSMGFAV